MSTDSEIVHAALENGKIFYTPTHGGCDKCGAESPIGLFVGGHAFCDTTSGQCISKICPACALSVIFEGKFKISAIFKCDDCGAEPPVVLHSSIYSSLGCCFCPTCALKQMVTFVMAHKTPPNSYGLVGPQGSGYGLKGEIVCTVKTGTPNTPHKGPQVYCGNPAVIWVKGKAMVCKDHFTELFMPVGYEGVSDTWKCTEAHDKIAAAICKPVGGTAQGLCSEHFILHYKNEGLPQGTWTIVPGAWATTTKITSGGKTKRSGGKTKRSNPKGTVPLGVKGDTPPEYLAGLKLAMPKTSVDLSSVPDAKVEIDFSKKYMTPGELLRLGLPPSTEVDLAKEAANFYVLGELARLDDKWTGEWRAFAKKLADQLATYIEFACLGELRYWPNRVSNDERLTRMLGGAYGPILKLIGSNGLTREQVWLNYDQLAKAYGPKWLLRGIVQGHGSLRWPGGGFGGPKWANCARTVLAYRRRKLTPVMFVDYALGLAHNGDIVYNKLWRVDTLKTVLDHVRAGRIGYIARKADPVLVEEMRKLRAKETRRRARSSSRTSSTGS